MLDISYAGMKTVELAAWIGIATFAGWAMRALIKGPRLLGLWSDMAIALIGVFAVGWALQRAGIDLSQSALRLAPGTPSQIAIWADVLIVALLGSLVVRLLMRPFGKS